MLALHSFVYMYFFLLTNTCGVSGLGSGPEAAREPSSTVPRATCPAAELELRCAGHRPYSCCPAVWLLGHGGTS